MAPLLMLAACGPGGVVGDTDSGPVDVDEDGVPADEDCDDFDAAVGAPTEERCDGVDNDCDGEVDEGLTEPFYADMDGDGYGDADAAVAACEAPDGHVGNRGDCDDSNADVRPDAPERCNGRDDDCDGSVDEAEAVDARVWFLDADGDGYGEASTTTRACDRPPGYVEVDADCDDADGEVHPWAGDQLDDDTDGDCDGLDCEAGWRGEAYFALCPGVRPWADWVQTCEGAGYDGLASIRSASEDDFVFGLLFLSGRDATTTAWIGFTDADREGDWVWTDGSTSTYTRWSPGEPNDVGDEDCAHVNWPLGSGGWNDVPCSDTVELNAAVCGLR